MQVSLIGFCIAGVSVTAEYVTALWILIVLSQNLREIALAKIGLEDDCTCDAQGAGWFGSEWEDESGRVARNLSQVTSEK